MAGIQLAIRRVSVESGVGSVGTVLAPTAEIRRVADGLLDAAGAFYGSFRKLDGLGQYESHYEAFNQSQLLVRHIEGVAELALRDLVMFPAACTLARSALEISVRMSWMLAPPDVFEREGRYVAHLQSESDYLRRVQDFLSTETDEHRKLGEDRVQIRQFVSHVERSVRERDVVVKGLPNLRQMMGSLGISKEYASYIELSQVSHGLHKAGEIYRGRGVGGTRRPREFDDPRRWVLPMAVSWRALQMGGRSIHKAAGARDPRSFISRTKQSRMHALLRDLEKST